MDDEDKCLDNFFAKKDKGKKGKAKGKGKFTTSSRQAENSTKTVAEQTKDQKPSLGQTAKSANAQAEDEWVDFSEPKEKDYTGLKVQSLQIRDRPDEESEEGTGCDDEYFGDDSSERKEKSSNVWQAISQPTPQAVEPPKEEVKMDAIVTSKSVYVPPSMRGNAANAVDGKDQSWKYGRGSARNNPRRPPEIGSEIAFPSLQTSADVSSKSEAEAAIKYETVKHGARATSEQFINRRANIDIGNKYDALRQ